MEVGITVQRMYSCTGELRALLTFLGDALKSFVPVLIVKFVLCPAVPDLNAELIQLVTGFAAVMGHDYPVFLKFKGGKGIATTAAAMMAFDWRIGLCCFIIFVTVTAVTKYVSLASILLSAGIVVEILISSGKMGFICDVCPLCIFCNLSP